MNRYKKNIDRKMLKRKRYERREGTVREGGKCEVKGVNDTPDDYVLYISAMNRASCFL